MIASYAEENMPKEEDTFSSSFFFLLLLSHQRGERVSEEKGFDRYSITYQAFK